jgi:dihydrofolate reductase
MKIIVGYDVKNRGIGFKGTIPWKVAQDMTHFANITKYRKKRDMIMTPFRQNAIIMGKNTWLSLGGKPLPGRINIVISSTLPESKSYHLFKSLNEAVRVIAEDCDNIFVIGGERLYKEAMDNIYCNEIIVTELEFQKEFEYDTYFPEIPERFKKAINSELYAVDEKSDEKNPAKCAMMIISYQTGTNPIL